MAPTASIAQEAGANAKATEKKRVIVSTRRANVSPTFISELKAGLEKLGIEVTFYEWQSNEQINKVLITKACERGFGSWVDIAIRPPARNNRMGFAEYQVFDVDKGDLILHSSLSNESDAADVLLRRFRSSEIIVINDCISRLEARRTSEREVEISRANEQRRIEAERQAARAAIEEEQKKRDEAQQAQLRASNSEMQARWSAYSKREKTLLEKVVNYSLTGIEDGDELNFSVSGIDGNHRCVVTSYMGSPQLGRIDISSIDIRSFNERGFRINIAKLAQGALLYSYGDESRKLTAPFAFGGPVLERLQKAWGLAFKECPGRVSAF
ncbi:MAG: hypothetical protein JNN22_14890 [Rhodospirillales bacterium]|nr:hypothetical protein [Rhodospirillales bacterium]